MSDRARAGHHNSGEALPHRNSGEALPHRNSGEALPHRNSGEALARPESGAAPAGPGTRYVLLIAPSANRVYAEQTPRLAMRELAAFGQVVSSGLHDIDQVRLGGVPYIEFRADLTDEDVTYLSHLSSAYALFVREGELLRPVPLRPPARFDDDLITIPKYAGKTNEQFTQLLLNLTVLASGHARAMWRRPLVVLDPLCGRGTTLNQALRYGYHAIGIEVDAGHVEAYSAFLRTYLRRKRIKHTIEVAPVRRERKRVARRLSATLAPTKPAYKAGQVQRVTVFQADTTRARELLRAGSCDLIVADAPYGVAHGSRTEGQPGPSRNPLDLLSAALPGWTELLRRGGALGLSFNTYAAGRDKVAALLNEHGLSVVTDPAYEGLAHRVDQGITRDVVVARKP